MIFKPTHLGGSYEVQLNTFADRRGWFTRFFDKEKFREIGHLNEWVQMNHSFTADAGTVRGMHFQLPPHAEVKLVRCVAGAVFDVMVDLRSKSPTFLQWYATKLSAEKMNMVYIPEGFAHGFQTLTNNCELLYLHSAAYKPASEGGLRFDDPFLKVQWPLPVHQLSERDMGHPLLTDKFGGI